LARWLLYREHHEANASNNKKEDKKIRGDKMKNLKNLTAAITLLAVLVLSTASANAGILMSDRSTVPSEDPCVENGDVEQDSGILMSDFAGIIIAGFTGIIISGNRDGIIISGNKSTSQVNCGILMSD
jgi:hypothetical protein